MGSSFTKNIASLNNKEIESAIKEKLGITKNDKQWKEIEEYRNNMLNPTGTITDEDPDEELNKKRKKLLENNALITEKDKNKLMMPIRYKLRI